MLNKPLLTLSLNTHTLLEMEPAMFQPLELERLSPTLMSLQNPQLLLPPLLLKDQSQLLLMPLVLPSNFITVESLRDSVEPHSTTVFSLLDMELMLVSTTGSSRTLGALDGERRDTSESRETWTRPPTLVSADFNSNHPTQASEIDQIL
jgi:hypothetical protein